MSGGRRRPIGRHAPPSGDAPPCALASWPGVAVRGDGLTIGLRLGDGVVLMHLAGDLDRETRPLLLRVARRVVRSSTGHLVVDCVDLRSSDEAGLDALGSLRRLPGVESVALLHVDPDLGRRLGVAGLADRFRGPVDGSTVTLAPRTTG